jgi:hypothetical protein
VRLFQDLLMLTHEQYRYPWSKAARASLYLARAAARFGNLRGDYDQVLPDLERAYVIARDWTGGAFDPAAVARAELAWWVARRDPARNAPEQVGELLAHENSLLYGLPIDRLRDASVLRARAGWLRDQGGDHADWPEVSRLLHESFRRLHASVQ